MSFLNLKTQVSLSVANGFISDAETASLVKTIKGAFNKTQLKDVFDALKADLSPSTLSSKNRRALADALFTRSQELKADVVPLAVTEAVGEDEFGMGNIEFPGRTEVAAAAADGTVSTADATKLAKLLDAAKQPYQLNNLLGGLKTLVNSNLISVADRSKLASAALAASLRVNGNAGGMMLTRAIGEDAFGFDPNVIGNDKIAKQLEKAGKNGTLNTAELRVLEKEIKTLDADGLKAAETALRSASQELSMTNATRKALITALATRGKELGVFVIHPVVTMAVGEDTFGIAPQLNPAEQKLIAVANDSVMSSGETTAFVKLVKKVESDWQLDNLKEKVGAFLATNVVSAKERNKLAQAFQTRAIELGGGYAATRALGEDIFGM